MKRPHRFTPATLEDKLAYWISNRINVLFRCGPGVGIASEASAAFATVLRLRVVDFEGSCPRKEPRLEAGAT